MITLTLPMAPSANRYWRVSRGIIHRSTEAKAYKIAVEDALRERDYTPLAGEIRIVLRVFRERRSGDLDNRQKVILDSLQGICYHNDSQIKRIEAERFEDKQNPRIEIEVWPIE